MSPSGGRGAPIDPHRHGGITASLRLLTKKRSPAAGGGLLPVAGPLPNPSRCSESPFGGRGTAGERPQMDRHNEREKREKGEGREGGREGGGKGGRREGGREKRVEEEAMEQGIKREKKEGGREGGREV